ncbi:MAG: SEL1-like repeat protein, partial [Hyphomonadaceae bacterium]|nr:SEL1-like repeat protein [Hyphomonadaceae bacterium]
NVQAGAPTSAAPPAPTQSYTGARTRPSRFTAAHYDGDDDDDWSVSGPTTMPRVNDPIRLAQRIETIERRTQLAVTGLDRAVSTIDRSVLGLAARIEDVEAVSNESAERIADAIDQFRIAGETLSGRLAHAEQEAHANRDALASARTEVLDAKERLEGQVKLADEVGRRAEAAATFLSGELESRDAATKQTLAEARAVAEEAARQAAAASAEAVVELRRLQEAMSERLAESESSTRRAVETAIQGVRAEAASGARETLLTEVSRLEAEIAKRLAAADALKEEQATLIARIERAEASARESTAGLRQAAGAAIADLRNSQLTLAARLKQVEEGGQASVDVTELRQQQQDITERLAALETKTDQSPVTDALSAFERRIAEIEDAAAKKAHVEGAVTTLDSALQRLSERLAETESTANTAIRTLEETVSALGAKVEQAGGAAQETEALRALLEQRLGDMAQSVRDDLANQVSAALEGGAGVQEDLADLNRRLAAAERRQAQTIEAISLEIKRMSESVDKRLRSVEARNDDAAAAAVREELTRMASTLEARFDEIERREAAAFDRMGLEVGRLSERLEDRVGAVEARSAQAIEQVGEQVARMADRLNQRHDILARDLSERMLDSEERGNQRVSEAIGSIMQRLAEVEEHSAEAIAPVQKAVSSVASKLEQFESAQEPHLIDDAIPTPSRRAADFDFPAFGEIAPKPYVSPMDAAQPVRAAPLPPRTPTLVQPEPASDIYFAEESGDLIIDEPEDSDIAPPPPVNFVENDENDLLIDDTVLDDVSVDDGAFAPPPPADEDPFWSPSETLSAEEAAAEEEMLPPVEPIALDLVTPPPAEEEKPAGKNDYLANARRAAQAQAAPKVREPGPTPQLSLRGSSRVVLWGATALVLLAAGGYWYMNRSGAAPAPQPTPADDAVTPLQDTAPVAPFEAPAPDPFAEANPNALESAPTGEAAAPAPGAPVAQAPQAGAQPQVVAGPLGPRLVTLEQAAQGGDMVALYELGLQRISAGRAQEGVTLLRRAADRGLAMAQYRMAKLYERGEGVPADLAQARQWTERAAAGGNRRAMHDLGVYFARGEGAPLDEAAAFRWFRQAAELGVADSQYNLGVLYQQGRGVTASPSEALFWFLVAARQGDQDAAARASAIEAQVAPIQVEQARARAQAFRPRAAIAVANGEFGPRPWAARPAT